MIRWLRHMVLLLALTGLFCSCSQVEDARRVVAEADSLRAVGTTYDDSLSIAKAAATLSHVRSLYPTDYARANYYYGRLLRNRGDLRIQSTGDVILTRDVEIQQGGSLTIQTNP